MTRLETSEDAKIRGSTRTKVGRHHFSDPSRLMVTAAKMVIVLFAEKSRSRETNRYMDEEAHQNRRHQRQANCRRKSQPQLACAIHNEHIIPDNRTHDSNAYSRTPFLITFTFVLPSTAPFQHFIKTCGDLVNWHHAALTMLMPVEFEQWAPRILSSSFSSCWLCL